MSKSTLNALAAVLLMAATVIPSHAGDLKLLIDETTSVIPTDVSYRLSPEGLEVQGWVAKRHPHSGRILGHVEIRLLDASGSVLARKDTYMVHYSPTRTNPQKASFSTLLPEVPEQTAVIEVAHRVGKTADGR
ncbi:hypothetical protein [Thiocapsa marina]|uniref:Uncharacterized protein n=1 Tax=Thiocapsa marina 5811 TaxID=768671 RepID=F9UC74_9GAMM|nr:hypothetical protein [Thiocapsa marina]EGV17987.1 hypothetical protein ThimaDRAFT_2526 [Thiocapsa marina 5811]